MTETKSIHVRRLGYLTQLLPTHHGCTIVDDPRRDTLQTHIVSLFFTSLTRLWGSPVDDIRTDVNYV